MASKEQKIEKTFAIKPSDIYSALKHMLTISQPVMIWGPPGIGKSSVVAQLAKDLGYTVLDLRLSQMDPSDLRGIPIPIRDESGITSMYWAIPGVFPKDSLTKVIIFLDEINTAPPSVQAAAYELILDRRIGEYIVPENCYIVAAGNRDTDKGATYKMAKPLESRFTHLEMRHDFDDFLSYAIKQKFHSSVISYLINQKDDLFQFNPMVASKGYPTPRTWEFVSHTVGGSGFDNLSFIVKKALVGGTVGDGIGIKFMEFYQNSIKLPDPLDILAGKLKDKKISDISACWCLTISLCQELNRMYRKIEEKDSGIDLKIYNQMMDNFFWYLMRNMMPEFVVLAFSTIIGKFDLPIDTKNLKAWKEFDDKYGEMIVA